MNFDNPPTEDTEMNSNSSETSEKDDPKKELRDRLSVTVKGMEEMDKIILENNQENLKKLTESQLKELLEKVNSCLKYRFIKERENEETIEYKESLSKVKGGVETILNEESEKRKKHFKESSDQLKLLIEHDNVNNDQACKNFLEKVVTEPKGEIEQCKLYEYKEEEGLATIFFTVKDSRTSNTAEVNFKEGTMSIFQMNTPEK